jgi:hypothetical protein
MKKLPFALDADNFYWINYSAKRDSKNHRLCGGGSSGGLKNDNLIAKAKLGE